MAFAILFAMRVEMPPIRASLAAVAAISTASISVLVSQIYPFMSSIQYSRPFDEAVSAFTSTAASCALIAWASQYGAVRTMLVAASSIAIVTGNLNWWGQDATMLTWMRLSEVVLALALAVGTSAPVNIDRQGSKPSKTAMAT